MLAAEESADGTRLIESDLGLDKCPGLLEIGLGAREFEVVDVDDEEKLQLRVSVATLPLADGLEAQRLKRTVTMLFPIAPRVGMTIEGEPERTDGVTHTGL
ncbi:MAG: hypothetical protein NXH94_22500, partial [Rhodobacteraceae bacterium]|nr:hypothetical protein [Paracoccaceae bacterium]